MGGQHAHAGQSFGRSTTKTPQAIVSEVTGSSAATALASSALIVQNNFANILMTYDNL
jgi:hypothetical protein